MNKEISETNISMERGWKGARTKCKHVTENCVKMEWKYAGYQDSH